MHEVLLYGQIWAESSRDFVERIAALESEGAEELVVRVNTNGGNPEFGFGMISRFNEFDGPKKAIVDGKAYSMGAFFCACAEEVEANDASEFLIHRASYGEWFESSSHFTPELRGNLERINNSLKGFLKNSIDVSKLEAIMSKREALKHKKFKDIFSMDERIDVFLSAKEAKQIGLISKINKITPTKRAQINGLVTELAANFGGKHDDFMIPEIKAEVIEDVTKTNSSEANKKSNNINSIVMTKEEFQKEHPEAYNAIVKGAKATERDRVSAWMKFHSIDAAAVTKGIEDGSNLMENQAVLADLMIKMNDPKRAENAQDASAKKIVTKEVESKTDVEETEVDKTASVVADLMFPKTDAKKS